MRRLLLLAPLVTLVGCGSDASPEVKEPFKPSAPPPGYIEERLKARESAPKPGPPKKP